MYVWDTMEEKLRKLQCEAFMQMLLYTGDDKHKQQGIIFP